MLVHFKTMSGQGFQINCDEKSTIGDVKNLIADVHGANAFPVSLQKLICDGKVRNDHESVADLIKIPNEINKKFILVMVAKDKRNSTSSEIRKSMKKRSTKTTPIRPADASQGKEKIGSTQSKVAISELNRNDLNGPEKTTLSEHNELEENAKRGEIVNRFEILDNTHEKTVHSMNVTEEAEKAEGNCITIHPEDPTGEATNNTNKAVSDTDPSDNMIQTRKKTSALSEIEKLKRLGLNFMNAPKPSTIKKALVDTNQKLLKRAERFGPIINESVKKEARVRRFGFNSTDHHSTMEQQNTNIDIFDNDSELARKKGRLMRFSENYPKNEGADLTSISKQFQK
ncbi:ubiquitin family domain-containing protein [Ditylenchus destructor]|uniref:Ubiquitin family domain-containing protein n=1 Tax=Ditylenchus destructor TaxID=166010 RepID=A0AAD4NBL9_9BILA|nr:ubiquitin family domain-containing protein [Ditylenchus destructor]